MKQVKKQRELVFVLVFVLLLAGVLLISFKPGFTGNVVAGGNCNDGNAIDGDGCSAAGVVEEGWVCEGEPSVCTLLLDTIAPVVTILGNNPAIAEVGTSYTDAGATATDDFDGDLTSSIVVVNPVDANTAGTYTITYDVSDSAGNAAAQVTRTVNVAADAAPAITLTGNSQVTINVGTSYTDAGATATDDFDGDLTSSIVVVNPVDANTAGTYTITYDVSDSAGNAAAQVTRTVVVNVVTSCTEDWSCPSWDAIGCSDGVKTRTCIDNNDCGTTNDRPSVSSECSAENTTTGTSAEEGESGIQVSVTTQAIEEPAVCSPDWQCSDWSACVDLTQARECSDANNCGIEEGKPAVSQSCVLPETCSDRIRNQDERGVDCGGVCEKRCSIFTIVGGAVTGTFDTSKKFVLEKVFANRTINFIVLGVLVAGILGLLAFKFLPKRKK